MRVFQLPLSGSQIGDAIGSAWNGFVSSFNSLSRDHTRIGTQSELCWLTIFQLPLSGSQEVPIFWDHLTYYCQFFQLPLSGSQVRMKEHVVVVKSGTFNSLSRDHADNYMRRLRQALLLSTPSLGITL